ncbi:hypothetical protein GQ55_6G162400 [Panicum hallii var. hallii]|jgi:hypothetical protein|nr:hypothetical protein GQ55_6G162400 [Panicum hallii var. hallii]PUZ51203.1 hypothetical protein GQ55_6G162400 [Panicum hallii var. hallii]PUZ51204.1 hypothetical protein GQ55_6G162400 [Panicum hallii var. hallii]PUZ51206.1 hypothetical protein GQ55_6G162400 [Panicum hallii var. hallii]
MIRMAPKAVIPSLEVLESLCLKGGKLLLVVFLKFAMWFMLTGLEFVWWFHLLLNVLYHASVLIFISIHCCFHDAPFCWEDAPKISISYIHFYPFGGILVIFGFGALHPREGMGLLHQKARRSC